MKFVLLDAASVELIHEQIIQPNELQGRSADQSLDSTIARVNNRLAYGLILDVFDLATAYAAAISQGLCFLDANRRTAFQAMDVILDLNGIRIDWCIEEVGDRVIDLAQCRLDEAQFASWLRTLVD